MPRYDSSDDGDIVVIDRPRSRVRHGSSIAAYDIPERYGPPALLEGNNYLTTDLLSVHGSSGRGRQRSSSVNINIDPHHHSRGPSHDRRRERSRGRRSSTSSSSEEEDIGYGDHSYHHHHRHELAMKLAKLKILEEEERKRQEQKRVKEEIERAKYQEAYDLAQKKKREKELLEEAQREEDAKKAREMRQKMEEDRKFAEKFIAQLRSLGYTEEQARAMLQRRMGKDQGESMAMGLSKPTWIRVHRKYLAIETLEFYSLPWEWDEVSVLLTLCRSTKC
jgi:flagellar biosynthesis GTPase FlhF